MKTGDWWRRDYWKRFKYAQHLHDSVRVRTAPSYLKRAWTIMADKRCEVCGHRILWPLESLESLEFGYGAEALKLLDATSKHAVSARCSNHRAEFKVDEPWRPRAM